jgi:putative aldouronate transport system permease protein
MMRTRKKRFHFSSNTPFDIVSTILLVLALLIVFYPLYFVAIASISDANAISSGQVILIPKNVSLVAYRRIFQDSRIFRGYANAILYTLASVAIGTATTIMAGFALSRDDLPGRRILSVLYVFTMYFSGGLIPTYLVVKNIGLLGSPWSVILMGSFSAYNIIIARSFFTTNLPPELYEAASVDGCPQGRYFLTIAVPLSKAIIAVIALYYAVAQWNSYFNAMIYLSDQNTYPLQLVLREVLLSSQSIQADVVDVDAMQEMQRIAATIKYGVIIVASLPMLIIYPFVQKYFVKGVMIGSVKG